MHLLPVPAGVPTLRLQVWNVGYITKVIFTWYICMYAYLFKTLNWASYWHSSMRYLPSSTSNILSSCVFKFQPKCLMGRKCGSLPSRPTLFASSSCYCKTFRKSVRILRIDAQTKIQSMLIKSHKFIIFGWSSIMKGYCTFSIIHELIFLPW